MFSNGSLSRESSFPDGHALIYILSKISVLNKRLVINYIGKVKEIAVCRLEPANGMDVKSI
jgi:hypothetical protein